jgi:ribosomal-protein-alanine N-acetyltransferase
VNSASRLTTPRLIVRPYTAADAPAYLDLCLANREHLARFEADNPAREVSTLAEVEALLARYGEWASEGILFFGVFRAEDAALLAQVVLMLRNADLPEYEVGYIADHRHTGHGYVTEATRAVVGYAFSELGAKRVSARCSDENPPSQRVLERCGFTLEGILRDCNPRVPRLDGTPSSAMLYGVLRGEWEASPQQPGAI